MSNRFKRRRWALLALALCCPALWSQRFSDLAVPVPIPPGGTLVIGFLGGFDRWNDEHRGIRELTLRLRQQPGVYAESISNHHRSVALKLIRLALDTNHNGKLDPEERARARIILYGQSWGGAAAIATARDLDRLGVPVLLTVQVDSVGVHDESIPPNVQAAVNFFQHDPLTIQGRREIRAVDPAKTHILGNFQASYFLRPIDESNASWARRAFGGSHVKMELDPTIWIQVERYIGDAISRR
jgi:hypothetical protein